MQRRTFIQGIGAGGFGAGSFGTLIDQSYGPNVTKLDRLYNKREGVLGPTERTGPIRSNVVPFRVLANAPALVISVQNPYRKGLSIQNNDPTQNLFVGFGILADANGFRVGPLTTVLFDFVCPTDAISVFALFDISGFMLEMAPIGE